MESARNTTERNRLKRLAGPAWETRIPRVAVLALLWLVLAAGVGGRARAQLIEPEETGAALGTTPHDYFARSTDPATAVLLGTVERYHLAESFWRYYRQGEFSSVRADLQYVLRYFPNHPRVLQIIAYDPNVKQDPSVVIQQFELAIRIFPGHAYTCAQYGRYLLSIGRRSAGLELLDQALRMDPDLVVALAWRAEGQTVPPQAPSEPPGGPAVKRPPEKSPGSALPRKR